MYDVILGLQISNMRSERIEIVLAFAGLLFACISAALIVAFAIPQPKTVVERIFQSALDVADTFAPLEMQIDLLVMPKMLKVGSHRRRLGELLNEVGTNLHLHHIQFSAQNRLTTLFFTSSRIIHPRPHKSCHRMK